MKTPFKFLDSYGLEDRDLFFGRDFEIEQLYKLIFQTRLLLIYGGSGTGKTSLIQCGLGNRFDPLDWFPIFVRRKDNLNNSLHQELRRAAVTPIADDVDIIAAIDSLYLDHLRPIYIVFDQFEELFVLGSAEEQDAFIKTVQKILAADIRCKIIISMREEYLAALHDFERAVPSLFDTRLRIEQMNMANIKQVITGTTGALGIVLENGAATAQHIIDNISHPRAGVQLSYLQVYLDKLYRGAATTGTPRLFTDALVAKVGKLEDVLADFVEEQTGAIQAEIALRHPDIAKDAVRQILEKMTTIEGTKQPMTRTDLVAGLTGLEPVIDDTLRALEGSRILREADGIYELAHDSLAGRIAERRSADRKALMRVEKLVRDRFSGYEQTRTWLSPEELAVVRPVLPQLELKPEAKAFVQESIAKARRRRALIIGGTASIIAVLAAFGAIAWRGEQKAETAIFKASTTINDLTFTILDRMKSMPDTVEIRRALLQKVSSVERELGRGGASSDKSAEFWLNVLEGDVAAKAGRPEKANDFYTRSLGMAKTALETTKNKPLWQRNQSVALGLLGDLAAGTDSPADAVPAFREAASIDDGLVASAPDNMVYLTDQAISSGKLGRLLVRLGESPAARPYLEKAEGVARRLVKAEPVDAFHKRELAVALNDLGDYFRSIREFGKARRAYAEAADHMRDAVKAVRNRPDWRLDLARIWYSLGEISLEQGNWDQARADSRAAISFAQVVDGDGDGDGDSDDEEEMLTDLQLQRSFIERSDDDPYHAQRAADAARAAIALARTLIDRRADDDDDDDLRDLANAHRRLSEAELARCRLDDARDAARDALAIAEQLSIRSGDDDFARFDLYAVHEHLGVIEHQAGRLAAARMATAKAGQIAESLKVSYATDAQLQSDLSRIKARIADLDRGVSATCRPV